MSNNGGARHGADEPTSFVLRPPNGQAARAPEAQQAPPNTPDTPSAQAQQAPPNTPVPPNQPHAQAEHAPAAPAEPPRVPHPPARVPHPLNPYAAPVADPGTGRLIAGRYRLLAKLGHGGMGTVWRAKDETVDREVAVKEPRVPDHLPERERANVFERMRREARAAARLDHPAVVNVHDVAVVDGQPWIVMELVRGRSLGDALQEGTLDAREAARIGLQVLGALEAAHAAGILHRDVKPDNVLLGRHGRVVLADFGIARIEGETSLTDTGGFVGSPEYIAPERVLGQRPGPASDLWSLGVVLYAATEGLSPFRRSNTPATLQSVLNAAPAPPAAARGPLAEAVTGLLRKDPAQRPDAAQVRALLKAAAEPPAPVPPAQAVTSVDGTGAARRRFRPGRGTWLGLGAAAVAAAVAAYLLIADPFAGPLPDGWRTRHEKDVAATLAVPAGYRRVVPDPASDKGHWVRYDDWSGSVWISLALTRRAEDTGHAIKDSAAAQMYDDNGTYKQSGDYSLDMPSGPGTDPKPQTAHQGKPAAENTVVYTTDDSDNPRPRELRLFYYKSTAGDLYKLTVSYPGKGDFTDRGREVARTAIRNLDIDRL